MLEKKYAIGVDIGGSHISCALVDLINGEVVPDTRIKKYINNKASFDEILENWKAVLIGIINKAGIDNIQGIGFAMPGPFDYEKGIALFDSSVDKFENLHGIDIGFEMNCRLNLNKELPFYFINDASAFAVGESWIGETSKFSKNISITLGTGFGSAFMKDGVPVVEGVEVSQLGCLWHLPFKGGIADDFFSTRWFINRWKEIAKENVDGVKYIAEKAPVSYLATSLFIEFGTQLGEFLGPWIKHFGAEALVIGGNIGRAYYLFGPAFETQLNLQKIKVKIVMSNLKEDAAIIGSARMTDSEYFNKIESVLPKM